MEVNKVFFFKRSYIVLIMLHVLMMTRQRIHFHIEGMTSDLFTKQSRTVYDLTFKNRFVWKSRCSIHTHVAIQTAKHLSMTREICQRECLQRGTPGLNKHATTWRQVILKKPDFWVRTVENAQIQLFIFREKNVLDPKSLMMNSEHKHIYSSIKS